MNIFYLNHNILEHKNNKACLLNTLKEIAAIREYLISKNANMYVYSNIWDIRLYRDITLKEYIHSTDKKELGISIINSIVNNGPFYFSPEKNVLTAITPEIPNETFPKKLMEICYFDKQELVTSVSDENYLTSNSYILHCDSDFKEIYNCIGVKGISEYFNTKVTFSSINDVFSKIESEDNSKIKILDSAKKSSNNHNFMNKFKDIYTCIITLHEVENLNLSTHKKIDTFYQKTGFEISPESERTLKVRKYKREREFNISKEHKELFEWHIKIGHSIRIHYFFDQSTKLIYIGHCGKHLGTVSYNS